MPQLVRNSNGSVLIEAILSVVILSTGLTLIVRSMATAVKGEQRMAEYATAIVLADNVMFEVLRKGKTDALLSQSAEFEEPFARFRYELNTSALSYPQYEEGAVNEVRLHLFKSPADEQVVAVTTHLPDSSHHETTE